MSLLLIIRNSISRNRVPSSRITPNNVPILQFPSVIYSVETRGHRFIVNLDGFFIRIAFQLHGQVVVCNGDVFEEIIHEKYHLGCVAWQLAIKLDDILPQPTVLLFVDYNRLMRAEIIVLRANVQKWGKDRNYDPIDEWDKYEKEIRKQIPQIS